MNLRSRKLPSPQTENQTFNLPNAYSSRTSTPEPQPQKFQEIQQNIQNASALLRSINEIIDNHTSAPNLTSLFCDTSFNSTTMTTYDKEMAKIMATNIPKFELKPNTDHAIELRSFIKACENVLKLYENPENNS